MSLRTVARYAAVTLMGLGVLVATADGFANSFAGLYGWAIEHRLTGWRARSFPLLVDTFIGIGELGLFLMAIDGHRLRRSLLSWLDLCIPAAVAVAGWGASLVFNIGNVRVHAFSYQATAAVPPLASMVGLLVLLRTLHRYVTRDEGVAIHDTLSEDEQGTQIVRTLPDPFDATPPRLLAWFTGEDVPAVPAGVPDARTRAAEMFAEQVRRGETPGIRAIKRRLRIGQDRAREVRAYLADLAENQPAADDPLDASPQVNGAHAR